METHYAIFTGHYSRLLMLNDLMNSVSNTLSDALVCDFLDCVLGVQISRHRINWASEAYILT